MNRIQRLLAGTASAALVSSCTTVGVPGTGPSAEVVTPTMIAEDIVPSCRDDMKLATVEGGAALGIGQGSTTPSLAAAESSTIRYDEVQAPQTIRALSADLDRMIRLSGCRQIPYELAISSDEAVSGNATCEVHDRRITADGTILDPGKNVCTITLSRGLMDRLTPEWYETEEAVNYGYRTGAEDEKPVPSAEDIKRWRNFILAHEYSHLLMNHPQQYKEILEQSKAGGQAITTVGVLAAGAKIVATAYQLNQSGNSYAARMAAEKQNAQAAGVFLGAAVAGMWLNAEVQRASYPPQVRALENDADYLAALILMRADRAINAYNEENGTDTPLYEPEIGATALEHLFNENKTFSAKLKEEAETAGKTVAASASIMGLTAGAQMLQEASGGQDLDIRKTMQKIAFTAGAAYLADRMQARYDADSYPLHANPSVRVNQIVAASELLLPENMREQVNVATSVLAEPGQDVQVARTYREEDFYGLERASVTDEDRTELASNTTTSVYLNETQMLADASKIERLTARGELEEAKAVAAPYWALEALDTVPTALLRQLGTLALTDAKLDIAERQYEAILTRNGVPQMDYVITARAFMQAGDLDRAAKFLNLGETRTGQRTFFLPPRVEIAVLKEDADAITALLEECALDETTLEECQGMLPEPEAALTTGQSATPVASNENAAPNPIGDMFGRFSRKRSD